MLYSCMSEQHLQLRAEWTEVMEVKSIAFLGEHNGRERERGREGGREGGRDERSAEGHGWKSSVKSRDRYDNGRAASSRSSFTTSTWLHLSELLLLLLPPGPLITALKSNTPTHLFTFLFAEECTVNLSSHWIGSCITLRSSYKLRSVYFCF